MGTQAKGDLFTLRNVSKRFKIPRSNPFRRKETIQALDSVTAAIPRGKITCILGPNGAGKTTLIKIIASLITPDEGEILYDGAPLGGAKGAPVPRIGLVTSNDRSFYWRLSGRENLLFFASLHGLRGKDLGRRVDEVLSETGMLESAATPYRFYSAGMKQKLNIARALLGDPELYLLDEPAVHLDPLAKVEFRDFIVNTLVARKKATVFLSTHDLEEASALAQEIIIIDSGKIIASGEKSRLLEKPRTKAELILVFEGTIPESWSDGLAVRIDTESAGRLRVAFDPAVIAQENIISSFVGAGGRLSEAYRTGDDLLDLIKAGAARHA